MTAMTTDDAAPQHDPLSEEMDLITFQEADARLYEELARTRRIIADLRASNDNPAELEAQERRLSALESVGRRLRAQRTQPSN
jgi:hypothetical protein